MTPRDRAPAGRQLKVRVKTAKRRKASSNRWLERQLNDPYVARARAEGYRARSAYKLIEMDDRYQILKSGDRVVDLGAAPGGWSEVAAARVGSTPADTRVVAIDYLDMDPLAGVTVLKQDFLDDEAPGALRAALGGHMAEIIDGRDLIGLTETELMLPIDEAARRMVLSAAKRVALVTTVSPRALVDVLFVAIQVIRLIRQLATLYAGRPGTLGFLRLARAAIAHLAVTGGIAAGDSLVQQILGHGLAARLSARLGEGVINGLLTARVGIAAIEVCRPLPFVNGNPPRLGDVMAELRQMGTDASAAKTED